MLTFDWSSLVLFGGIMNTVMSILVLVKNRSLYRRTFSFWIILFLVFVGCILFERIIRFSNLENEYPQLLFITSPMFFFILPLVYMFQCRLIKKGSNTWYYHFIIPTAMLILLLPSIAMNSQSKLSMYNEQGLKDPVWIILFYFVFALYYTIKTFVVNKTHKANLLNVTANNDIELHLFSNRMVYMSSILIIAIPISLAMQYADFKTLLVDKVLFICFSFIPHFILISLLTFRSFTFTNEWNTHVKEHSDMEESKLEQLCSELTHFMQRHQPYLSQDLSLQVLANSMNWNRSNLSMVINKGFGKNFYDFINEYRLNAVIEKLNNKAFEVYSLDYLVSESGFKNYVSFYRIFKKVKNTTPKNYIEQLRDQ